MAIELTESAVNQINVLKAQRNQPDAVVQVETTHPSNAIGATGPDFALKLIEETDNVWVFDQDGVRVAVSKEQFQDFNGLEVDWDRTRGFVFRKPVSGCRTTTAQTSPCGSSTGVVASVGSGSSCGSGGCGSTPEIVRPSTSTGGCGCS
jgi:Fe-S cluster assembly iron-binding protein IscA